MGKNDLWIASTASILNAKLITTDKDFRHLDQEYIDLLEIDLDEIKSKIKKDSKARLPRTQHKTVIRPMRAHAIYTNRSLPPSKKRTIAESK